MRALYRDKLALAIGAAAFVVSAGASAKPSRGTLPPASFVGTSAGPTEKYVIGALDQLNIFVWRNQELSAKVQVRPDGMITTPLITDMVAVGKTPAQLADDIKHVLSKYIDNPQVSVMVDGFQKLRGNAPVKPVPWQPPQAASALRVSLEEVRGAQQPAVAASTAASTAR